MATSERFEPRGWSVWLFLVQNDAWQGVLPVRIFVMVGTSTISFVSIYLAYSHACSAFVQVSIFLLWVCPTSICMSSSSSSFGLVLGGLLPFAPPMTQAESSTLVACRHDHFPLIRDPRYTWILNKVALYAYELLQR